MRKEFDWYVLFAFGALVVFLGFLLLLAWIAPPERRAQSPLTSAALVTWGDEVAAHLEE